MRVQPAYDSEEKTFPKILDPIPLDDGKRWRLEKPFTACLLIDGFLTSIVAPPEFITDFASIPRLVWPIVGPPWGEYGKPAVIHDYLYYSGQYPKEDADEIFLVLMGICKVKNWKKRVMYLAVYYGGGGAWNRHRERERKAAPCSK